MNIPEWRDDRLAELDAIIAENEAREFRERLKHTRLRGFRERYRELTDRQRALIGRGVPISFFQPDIR